MEVVGCGEGQELEEWEGRRKSRRHKKDLHFEVFHKLPGFLPFYVVSGLTTTLNNTALRKLPAPSLSEMPSSGLLELPVSPLISKDCNGLSWLLWVSSGLLWASWIQRCARFAPCCGLSMGNNAWCIVSVQKICWRKKVQGGGCRDHKQRGEPD